MYRREGEPTWKPLRKAVTESILVWDTTTVPTGTYFVKIVASDSPSNPLSSALAGELESSAFDIDTVPPDIIVKGVRVDRGRTIVSFDVKDDHSPVSRVAVSARFLFGGSCRSAAGDLLARTVARSKSHKTFAVTDRRGVWPSKRERETASSNPSIISTCSAAVARWRRARSVSRFAR